MPRAAATNRRSPLTPLYIVLGVIAVAGVVFLATRLGGGGGGGTAASAPLAEVVIDSAALQRTPGISIGNPDAPVVIFEFADFQCFGCAQFARFVIPAVKERWVESGTARFVFYDFPLVSLHANAFLAARAGRCALEQEKFWEYHDVLYGRQSDWSEEPTGKATELFIEYSGQVGADRGAFTECLRSDRYAREVTQSMRFGESLGVNGTPSLFINGKRLQNIPSASQFGAIIEAEAGGARPAAPAGSPDAEAGTAGAP